MHARSISLILLSLAAWLCATCRIRADETPISFELDVQPILTAHGCNAGACHGKQRGQNGFQLSLLGFDADFDFAALTRQARGRRVFPAAPKRSLLLRKPTGELPHGGGIRLTVGDQDYTTILHWIEQGMQRKLENEPALRRIEVHPSGQSFTTGQSKRLRITAQYTDGSARDVTRLTSFQSNEAAVVAVDERGLMTAGSLPGETSIMARYMNLIGVSHVVIPVPGRVPDELYASLPRNNFIDSLVWEKLQSLGITPSASVGDATFLRRAHLDIIGRLPTPEEVRSFLADKRSDKRSYLVKSLLERPEYVDFWANKWADLLRPNAYRVGIKAVLNYDNWIRQQFRDNRPYDEFVQELLTARGSTWRNGAVTLFRDRRSPEEIATMVSQLFLGVRLECARCHHHPSEKWGQDDFYSFAAYFSRIGRKGKGLSPPISGSEEMILTASKGSGQHPLTGQTMSPSPLFGEAEEVPSDGDWRETLAAWMTSGGSDYLSRVQVNRVWADLMGRGLVEPVDDLRATNPATNEPLLAALADEFRRQNYDLKQLIYQIATSHVYGLSSLPTERNIADTKNHSRHYRRRLRAEVLHDAICDITGVGSTFAAMPADSRASQIWSHRVESLFLDTFGRPDANQDPPCERTRETAVTQTLHLMNSPELHAKVTSKNGRAAQLAASDLSDADIVEQIYLLVYSRFPDSEEQDLGQAWFSGNASRREAAEDLIWALVNTPEFLFVD